MRKKFIHIKGSDYADDDFIKDQLPVHQEYIDNTRCAYDQFLSAPGISFSLGIAYGWNPLKKLGQSRKRN